MTFMKPSEGSFSMVENGGNYFTEVVKNKSKSNLPISKYLRKFLYLLENNQVILLSGETGCGKSTQVGQFCLDYDWSKKSKDKSIVITEPRRIGAISLAEHVAEQRMSFVGGEVGYCVQFDDKSKNGYTKIKYVTEGILIQELLRDPLLEQYSVVILDEVHEQSITIDILLGILKKILLKRDDLKLIVSSATLDSVNMRDFFSDVKVVSLHIGNRQYEINIHYLQDPCADYIKKACETCLDIVKSMPQGDILVFLTSYDDIEKFRYLMQNEYLKKDKVFILPLHGSLPQADQRAIFDKVPHQYRCKIIASTNIAETSITIPGISYVVDCMFYKTKVIEGGFESLMKCACSKFQSIQRAGRAGRLRSGHCFRLTTKEDFDSKLSEQSVPDVQKNDLTSFVLLLFNFGISNLLKFEMPSKVPIKNLTLAIEMLHAWKAISDTGSLTELGRSMIDMPLNPVWSKVILESLFYGCTEEIILIAAACQVRNIWFAPDSIATEKARRNFAVEEGDAITILNMFKCYTLSGKTSKFCNKFRLNYTALKAVDLLAGKLKKIVVKLGFKNEIKSCGGNVEKVVKCLVSGFFMNAAQLGIKNEYTPLRSRSGLQRKLVIHPSSVLFTEKSAKTVIFFDLQSGSPHDQMTHVTPIQADWLFEIAPHFYRNANPQTLME